MLFGDKSFSSYLKELFDLIKNVIVNMRILPLLCFFWSLTSCAQQAKDMTNSDLSASTAQKIDALFRDFDHLESPGYAIGISKEGENLYMKGYGSANLDYNIPITTNSVFSIASVSKQFTTACIALLILEGKLSLETPAGAFIPALRQYSDTIRVKHLIYNSSGLPEYFELPRKSGKSWITFNYFDIDECIENSLAQGSLQFSPGDRWDYCNVNFMLLTKIVEKVSGQPFRTFARERLFQPLKMNNTFIHDDITVIVKNRVMPYNLRTSDYVDYYAEQGVIVHNKGKYIQHHRNAPHYGGSGVMTTMEDLMKWCKNMVTHELGGEPFYELMHRTEKFNHDRDNQAMGMYHGDFNGRKMVAWDGGDWGISSQLMRFPEQGVAIVVLSNLGSGESFKKVNEIADILIEEKVMK